jgi:beta-glucosidase
MVIVAGLALAAGLAVALLPGRAGAATATATATTAPATAGPEVTPLPLPPTPPVSACPWLQTAMTQKRTPVALANLVLARMTLEEKLGEVVLAASHGYENVNAGVARLCIPSLTLQDGPAGLAYGDTDVTQLPAPLALAATFDTSLAKQYGTVLGSEARGQGIDVVQSPNLNIDRVPQNGRGYEGFGEDPLLVSAMGVAEIGGIQSQGTLAQAKHFVTYGQETNRGELDTVVSPRALQEIYLPPFKAAVQQAHVASVMCAYPQLNDVFQCQDPTLTQILHGWGFTGFIRSDLGAVHNPVTALAAGTDLLKPANVARLARSVREGLLPVSSVDNAVRRILSTMFATGLVGRTSTGSAGTPVDSLSDGLLARQVAERSAVLLKNRHAVLPLSPSSSSVAVIGADASTVPVTAGFGSSYVGADFTSTPLAAIRRQVGPHTVVRYADGGSTTAPYPSIPSQFLAPSTGTGHGLSLTVAPTLPNGSTPLRMLDPNIDVALRAHPSLPTLEPTNPADPDPVPDRPRGAQSPSASTSANRTTLEVPANWSGVTASWTGTLTPPRTGLYAFSVAGSGSVTLSLDGAPAVSDPETHVRGVWSQSVRLTAGHPYQVLLSWVPLATNAITGTTQLHTSTLTLGWEYASDPIAAAVAAARSSAVAVVFAGDYSSEGFDRPSLNLPGDENALIAAVAAANPRTVVVLNTGNPVLMPWIGQVAGVIEDWYPGEEDGDAIAAVLFGHVNPSGRLPVTFPTAAQFTPAQWPGLGLVSTYSEGLQVGYRYDNANGIRPLFAFGFGLSYTRFTHRLVSTTHTGAGWVLRVRVTNAGKVAGTDVPQAYLTFPAAAHEPPAQLAAFQPVTLPPGRSAVVALTVPTSAFASYQGSRWTTVPGTYTLAVGESSQNLLLHTSVHLG